MLYYEYARLEDHLLRCRRRPLPCRGFHRRVARVRSSAVRPRAGVASELPSAGGEPFVKSIHGVRKLAEIRVRVSSDSYRVFFFTHTGRKMVLLHGFVKKSQKTPAREIHIAQQRMQDYLSRAGD